jgi:1,4-alpha-glucan branching enzyme
MEQTLFSPSPSISTAPPAPRRAHDQFVGHENRWAKEKCRLAWALTIAIPGIPMMFRGSECQMAAANVGWGYWNDETDLHVHGGHRFDWTIAGDPTGMEMRRLVSACNSVRWSNPALRSIL